MAITVDYSDPAQYVINIPRADMTLVQASPFEVRSLDIDDLRTWLMALQDEEEHVWAPTSHEHDPPFVFAGITFGRKVEILDPYVVQFEDGVYNVNVVGGNSNISDVQVKNTVGVNTANSAGLQDPLAFVNLETLADRLRKHLTNKMVTDPNTGVATLYDDDGVTPLESSDLFEDAAGTQPYRGQGAERRDGFSE